MPRFFFHFRNADDIAKDDDGVELPSLADAKAMALVSLRELVADNIKAPSATPVEAVLVTDGSGEEVITILATDVLPSPLQ